MSADHSHASPPVPPEPKTPMWLTALGAVLFALVGVYWLATPSSSDAAGAAAANGANADGGAAAPPAASAPAH